jgi:CheY-like chemotaxis protein
MDFTHRSRRHARFAASSFGEKINDHPLPPAVVSRARLHRGHMDAFRILHVEDEPDIREVVQFSLALDPEMSVKSFGNGSDALTAANDWRPDIILVDAIMPVMDGPQLLTHLRGDARTAAIPVIFMTACAQSDEVDHFLAIGAAGVIAKPFDPLTLAASVRAYLADR